MITRSVLRDRRLRLGLALGATVAALATPVGSRAAEPQSDSYSVRLLPDGDAQVTADLATAKGELVMVGGFRPDARSRNVAELRVAAEDGAPLAYDYEQAKATWRARGSWPGRVHLTYLVHLSALRSLPRWAWLQYGFFDGPATYLASSSLFVVPDALDAPAPALVRIEAPQGVRVVAPWSYDPAAGAYRTSVRGLASNSIVFGRFASTTVETGGMRVTAVLTGAWSDKTELVRPVLQTALARDLALFRGTPPADYLITLASGDEDGQAFEASNAISTRLPIGREDTEIWANTIAHELFHHWNGHLIRTQDPRLAFFTEGFTEYYANRQLLSAGLVDERRFWRMAGFHLGAYSYFSYSPLFGVSIVEAGKDRGKTRFGVYDGGWTVALCLDLALREASGGRRSLDDLMRRLWRDYGLTGKSLTYEGFLEAVDGVAGRPMDEFFKRYVAGDEELPFRTALEGIGVSAYDEPFGGKAYVDPPRARSLAYRRFLSAASPGAGLR